MTAKQSENAERESAVNGGNEKGNAHIRDEEVESHRIGESHEKLREQEGKECNPNP